MNRDRGMGQRPDAFVVLILVLVTCALAFVFGGRASAAPIVDVDVPLEAIPDQVDRRRLQLLVRDDRLCRPDQL